VTESAQAGQRSLRVPKENNRFLCIPSASVSQSAIDSNRNVLALDSVPEWLRALRAKAREQAIEESLAYLSTYVTPHELESFRDQQAPSQIVVGGHQPELFHPGVWFKNFLLYEIGLRTNSTSLHVIVDHDIARSDALRVPSLVDGEYFQRSVPLPMRSDFGTRQPWHTTLTTEALNDKWPPVIQDISRSIEQCGLETPVIAQRQDMLIRLLETAPNVGLAFSQWRHRIEIENGVCNLEVPLSKLCERSAFGLFFLHCVQNAESLWQSYNRCRSDYRSRHQIRNQVQPVLELQRLGSCVELPFWIYRVGQGIHADRKRLWVVREGDELQLCDDPDASARTIRVSLNEDENQLDSQWQRIASEGICIRPRALMTTMFLRCLVADLFVHGIGGGTYDELTDDIIRDWLGIDAPMYLTSSASVHLPFENRSTVTDTQLDWRWHHRQSQLIRSAPERFLEPTRPTDRQLGDRFAELLKSIPPRGEKRDWHREITQVKQQIEFAIKEQKQAWLISQNALVRRDQQDQIRKSREYSFVLFPEQDIVPRLRQLAQQAISE
jgi:hypothetical protein